MELNYKTINEYGMINENTSSKMHEDYGRCINFKEVNRYLFGITENLINICNLDLVKKNIIFKDNNGYIIKVDKIIDYLNYVDLIIDFCKYRYYLPFNYYLLTNKGMPEFYQKIYNLFFKFNNFLIKNSSLESETIRSFIFGKNEYFKGYLSNELSQKNIIFNNMSNNDYTSTILFNTGKGIFQIFIGENLKDNKNNYFDINKSYSDDKFRKLFEHINEKILMQDERSYIIHNLTRVIGNKSIAEIIFDSYCSKNEFTIPVSELEKIIIFKNDLLRKDYRIFFSEIYQENTIFKIINKNFYLNFEGFNKFLLNLSIDYLQGFEMKEFINELYFSITNELIKSYENLFRINKI